MRFSVLIFSIGLFASILNAQWKYCELAEPGEGKYQSLTSLSYCGANEAFATSIGRSILHTTDNWHTVERIESNIPPEQRAHYIEMSSKTDGILVTRKEHIGYSDRFYVWTTKNGGYTWDIVFSSPKLNNNPPNSSFRLYQETVLVKGFGDRLYVLVAEVLASGNKDGTDWEFEYSGKNRRHLNDKLNVFGNEIWQYWAASDFFTNINKKYLLWRDFPGTKYVPFLIGMDNKLQGILDSVLYERNSQTGEWERLARLPGDRTIQGVLQLSTIKLDSFTL